MSGHLSPNFVLPGPLSSEDIAYAVHTLTLNSFAARLYPYLVPSALFSASLALRNFEIFRIIRAERKRAMTVHTLI